MKLIIYPKLGTNSKRGLLRTTKKWGHPHRYEPKRELLNRLTKELGWTEQQVLEQLREEQKFLQKHRQYFL